MLGSRVRPESLVGFIARWRRYVHRHALAHAMMASLFLASVSLLYEDPALEWLDVAMLKIVPEFVHSLGFSPILTKLGWGSPSFSPVAAGNGPRILVLTIEPSYFDNDFGGRSPIPRRQLLALLETIRDVFFDQRPTGVRAPAVLAIDYDLSPNWKAPTEEQAGQEELNRFLEQFAISQDKDGKRRTLLLIRHLVDFNHASCTDRITWENRMQKRGLRFGHPELVHHALLDSVVKYTEDSDHFAAQLNAAATDGHVRAIEFQCRKPDDDGEHTMPPSHELKPINFLGARENVHVCPLASAADVRDLCAGFLGWAGPQGSGRGPRDLDAVVLGAGYDERDVFLTPLGQRPGAALHAYIAYSMTAPLVRKQERAFLIDFAIGASAGWLFFLLWCRYHQRSTMGGRFATAVAAFGVLGVSGVGLMILAPSLMERGWWLNPAPMLLAVFLDTWFNSVVTAEAVDPDKHSPFGWFAVLAYISWTGVVTAALVSLAFHVEFRWWLLPALWIALSLWVGMYGRRHPIEDITDEHRGA